MEEWRDIPGYEGLYQVSNQGRIKSLRKGTIMSPYLNNGGYCMVKLAKDSAKKAFLVHRLVWQSFNGKICDGLQVNHIDEDKTNNALCNLNLLDQRQNNNWGTHNERMATTKSKEVVQYSVDNKILNRFQSVRIAKMETGINNISACCRGEIKTAGGFTWRYA